MASPGHNELIQYKVRLYFDYWEKLLAKKKLKCFETFSLFTKLIRENWNGQPWGIGAANLLSQIERILSELSHCPLQVKIT